MSAMSIPQLMQLFNHIPRREEIGAALATVPFRNQRGLRKYDADQAGKALIEYYRRKEKSAMERYKRRVNPNSTHSLEMAKQFDVRASAIEARMKELTVT